MATKERGQAKPGEVGHTNRIRAGLMELETKRTGAAERLG
jgi:hypothetical protein